jgi:hypothetical protein
MVPVTAAGITERFTVSATVADQLAALRRRVETANTPGNLDGLFAHHVLSGMSPPIHWSVNPLVGAWMDGNRERAGRAPHTAALGYGVSDFRTSRHAEAEALLRQGLYVVMLREPFPADGMTFLRDPRQLLGIALGATAITDTEPVRDWLVQVLDDPRARSETPGLERIARHVRALLTGEPSPIRYLDMDADPVQLALAQWMILAGTARLSEPDTALQPMRRRLLALAVHTPATDLSIPDAALVHVATSHIVTASLDAAVLNRHHVGAVLRRFEAAMRRWRYDSKTETTQPVQWPINSETEVQDILWLILRSTFDDVVDEEPTRRLGHSYNLADFGIPSLGILIEVKYARSPGDLKKIEKEVAEDAVAYLRDKTYQKLIVFIYDESCSGQHHAMTAAALREIPNVEDVVIVSRPSQLPAPLPRTRTRARKSSASR